MNKLTKESIKEKIDEASVVSFDIFDTLLVRKTNAPETIYNLVGKHFGMPEFRKVRMREQVQINQRMCDKFYCSCADINQIYDALSEENEISANWNEVKKYEIQIEADSLIVNEEMKQIFDYAKIQGKRIVFISDTYHSVEFLEKCLEEKGLEGFQKLYCSSDIHKTNKNGELFAYVVDCENVPCEKIFHIGSKQRADPSFLSELGIRSFAYDRITPVEKENDEVGSEVDTGISKLLYDEDKGFWYNLGVEVGGPLYMGFCRFILEKIKFSGKKLYLFSKAGYPLYHVLKMLGYDNVEYVYTSRRALLLAAITEMNEQDIANLPPYTFGQTVGEVLDYLCVDRNSIRHLNETGLASFDTPLRTPEEIARFKKLYSLDKNVFLERCSFERSNALAYFENIGMLSENAFCFDCEWEGCSQELLERFKAATGCEKKHHFLYLGIKNGEKSRKQLSGMHYDAYLFDFYKNYSLQADLLMNQAMFDLFFSAPHENVHIYDFGGKIVFETNSCCLEKEAIKNGICDFVKIGFDFVNKYDVEYSPEISLGKLHRLIHYPTEEEAVHIGNLQIVDSYADCSVKKRFFAHASNEQLKEKEQDLQVYWPAGFFKRPDISEEFKQECAKRMKVQYPEKLPEYHLEDERNIRSFYRWIRHDEKRDQSPVTLNYTPSFSVVIPVYNTATEQLEECIQSVLNQNYDNYQLILVDDHSSWDNVRPLLQRYETESKVQVIYRAENGHISIATNDGIAAATGEFIVFMDCDDVIEPDALLEFAKKLNENPELDFIYSDEDKITEDGKIRHMPFFKPDWSPDLFMNMMYTNHLATYRASIVRAVGGLRSAYNGSQDYDFTLRFMEKSNNSRVGHVCKILYHWRERKESVAYSLSSKNYAAEAAKHAKEDMLRRNHISAHLEVIPGLSQYRIVYDVVGRPLVSIIIPSKDHPDILEQCINSIRNFTRYQNYEIVVVDNGSNELNKERTSQYLDSVGAKYIYNREEFNFSRMCNTGVANSQGDLFLFLNDDIEIFQPEWLERMIGHAQREHIGAVGAKLYFPQSTLIQHSGVSNHKDGPVHNFLKLEDQNPYYFGWNWVDNNCIAVTGACLLIDKKKYFEVGGFDEELAVAYNDVKLCFALYEKGYYNVVRNDVVAYHHESLSRGNDHADDNKLIRLNKERTKLYARFPDIGISDPFLNPNLLRRSLVLELKDGYDVLEIIDISDCLIIEEGNIDIFDIGDDIHVVGWSVLKEEDHIEELERFLIAKDPFGEIYGARTLPFSRPDVVAHFNDNRYLLSGFECVLSKKELRVDLMPYQLGILTVGRDGKRYLRWCYTTPVTRNQKPRPTPLECHVLDGFDYYKNNENIQWYVDAYGHEKDYLLIRGFAYKRGGKHYRYEKMIVLVDDDGKALEFATHLDERIDVAYTFIDEHFLYYTGFLCYIFEGSLEVGRKYSVFIRLKNRFDPKDVLDVATGHRVTG